MAQSMVILATGRKRHAHYAIYKTINKTKINKNNCLQTYKQTNMNSVGTRASNESTLTCVFL